MHIQGLRQTRMNLFSFSQMADTMKPFKHIFLALILLLAGCAKQAQAVPPTATASPTATVLPTETPYTTPLQSLPPDPTADPSLFGTIYQSEIQAFALESVANAIFSRTLDRFVDAGRIQEYQVMRVTVFPSGSGGLLSEITFNVRTTDLSWLEGSDAQAADDWINNKCYRFDFVTTETEFQLKNRRACS
jgi:hypothetical protein